MTAQYDAGGQTPSDNYANPTDALDAVGLGMVWNATLGAWERAQSDGSGRAAVSSAPAFKPIQSHAFNAAGDTAVIPVNGMSMLSLAWFTIGTGLQHIIEYSPDGGTTWFPNEQYNTNLATFGSAVTGSSPGFAGAAYSSQLFPYMTHVRIRAVLLTAGPALCYFALSGDPSKFITYTDTHLIASAGRVGYIAASGEWFDDSATPLAANGTFTSVTKDLFVSATSTQFGSSVAYPEEFRASAESDVAGTLYLEVSRDNFVSARRIKAAPMVQAAGTGMAFYAEIIHRPSTRYARTVVINGAAAQTQFFAQTVVMAI